LVTKRLFSDYLTSLLE
jgi:hypothetical protein